MQDNCRERVYIYTHIHTLFGGVFFCLLLACLFGGFFVCLFLVVVVFVGFVCLRVFLFVFVFRRLAPFVRIIFFSLFLNLGY